MLGNSANFQAGSYAGSIGGVKANIARYGRINRCRFVSGWFEETMPHFNEAIAAVYLDVDLASSTATCLRYLYPLVVSGGFLADTKRESKAKLGLPVPSWNHRPPVWKALRENGLYFRVLDISTCANQKRILTCTSGHRYNGKHSGQDCRGFGFETKNLRSNAGSCDRGFIGVHQSPQRHRVLPHCQCAVELSSAVANANDCSL
jgi:hypothetical protein